MTAQSQANVADITNDLNAAKVAAMKAAEMGTCCVAFFSPCNSRIDTFLMIILYLNFLLYRWWSVYQHFVICILW